MTSSANPLQDIINKLKGSPKENNESYRVTLANVFALTNSIEKTAIGHDDFKIFLTEAHNLLITGDSSKRSSLLRAIRVSLHNDQCVKALVDSEIHWIVVTSLERDSDYSMERMQAFKLMEKVRIIAAHVYPLSFGRSLVAVANYKDDNFRKLCLEALRELAIANPKIVAAVNGFSSLLEGVLEPISPEMADSILLTVLYLLNDPVVRRIVKPHVDLRVLLAPFTDLDSDPAEMTPRWKAARSALVLMMRSWVGVVLLTSEDMGLPTLVRMLQDPKVPVATQDVILDTISEVLAPVVFKVKVPNKNRQQKVWSSLLQEQKLTSHSSSSNLSAAGQTPNGPAAGAPGQSGSSDSIKMIRSTSGSQLIKQNSGNINSRESTDGGHSPLNSKAVTPKVPPKGGGHRASFSFSENIFATLTHHPNTSSGAHLPNSGSNNSISTMNSSSSGNSNGAAANAGNSRSSGFSLSAFFNNRNSTTSPGNRNSSRRGSSAVTQESPSLSSAGKKLGSSASTADLYQQRPFTESSRPPLNSVSSSGCYFSGAESAFDPIFNLLDNYTALLCCSFLHSNLIQSLFFLGSNGVVSLATKSRLLMVNYLRVLANIFPESKCSELLTMPSLIECAAATNAQTSRAHKASQMLISLADAFSLMPYKQISGSHISGLTSTPSNNVRLRSGSAPAPRNTSSSTAGGVSAGVVVRSNFIALNIQTVSELAEEIRIASFSNISTASGVLESSSGAGIVSAVTSTGSSSTLDVIKTLRTNLTPVVDKIDFNRQMELSRVIGKEGKEPFKWDWLTISDMLEYSFHHADRLSEALKTKWVRRVSGFYRCSVEEKGYFANLDWEPTNLQYLECACNMYSVLLKDDAGTSFLNSDRRGMLFTEIANEIEQLAILAVPRNSIASLPTKNVFRLYSCTCTMAREFFTLLGRIIRTTESRHLLDSTNIFQHLSKLGGYNTLDYISRLSLTSLSFTDGGFLSRHLMQLWTTQTTCSTELRIYFHSLLRVLLRCNTTEGCHWCVDAIVNQLTVDDAPTETLYKALEEAVQNKAHLKTIISKRPRILNEPLAQNLLVRFLSIPEGIEFASQKDWLSNTLTAWRSSRCSEYVYDVEEKISLAFNKFAGKHRSEMMKTLTPIPIETPEFIAAINARQSFYSSTFAPPSMCKALKSSGFNNSMQTSGSDPTAAECGEDRNNKDPNASFIVDLHGLLRVPWNIEVRLTTTAGYQGSSGSSVSSTALGSANIEYLKVDTFLDTTDLSSPLCNETSCDASRLVKVRGIILDNKGAPNGQPVAQNKVISNTLLAGICAIQRNGKVQCNTENRPQRRKSSVTSNTRESMTAAVSRPSLTLAAAAAALNELNADNDLPVTLQQDYLYDWSSCKPGHRQGNVCELGDGKFSVSIPGEPVVWIFSRRAPGVPQSIVPLRNTRAGSMSHINTTESLFSSSNSSRTDGSRSGGLLYLVEVQYFFRLETGHAMFVPMPRHIYGELARTLEGCAHLNQRNVISDLLSVVHRRTSDDPTRLANSVDMRSALWSLGHIGSSELGYTAIINADPMFVEWCLENIASCPNFSLRGTFFYVVGLLSRTLRGSRKLSQCQWDSAALGSNSAVAFPRNPSVLFKLALSAVQVQDGNSNVGGVSPPEHVKSLTPFMPGSALTVEQEVLNLVAKLPGVIVYRECKARLDHLRREHSEVFCKRSLYCTVHRMMETYTFKLTARRDILALFSSEAKIRSALDTTAVELGSSPYTAPTLLTPIKE